MGSRIRSMGKGRRFHGLLVQMGEAATSPNSETS